ncbi:polysaccharide biosynthesis/export family protein [Granulicella sp. L60]|uniref:polysaccharide biosynthesis/export family protein n=1 Tax=Granulicella sp. L60 TaxID=1641866 RepID=UPI00131BDF19|nr:polysaccharide biosynthesis/export family protein [Granulicella sp. L60]
MRQEHQPLKTTAAAAQPPARRPWLAMTLCVAAIALCSSAQAQFNGPSLGINTPVNPPVTITTDPAILHPGPRDFYLGTGDLLTIHLFGNVDYLPSVRVSLDGSVQLPLIGTLHVAGLTLAQAQELIAAKLVAAGMYRDPQVSIQVTESPNQIATVIGEVHGVVPIIGERRLLDVLAAVGGGGGLASGGPTTVVVGGGGLPTTASHVITINRPGVDGPISVDLGTDPAKSAQADIPIFPGDTIIVSRVGVVYLLGAFKIQGAIPLQQNSPMTLMKVAALAGGPGFEGKYNDLRIIRTTGLDRTVVKIDIKKVINGDLPDPVLQSEDIVFLPSSPMKAAIKNGGIPTLLGLASVLLYAEQSR